MAYHVRIETTCVASGCSKRATHQVFGTRNDSFGKYCLKHADARVRELSATERQLASFASARTEGR